MLQKITLSVFLLFLSLNILSAGGIQGTVKDEKGEPLAFATIFVKQTGSGTTTNVDGLYDLALSPGEYDITFQYVGFETVSKHVTVGTSVIKLDIVMQSQAVLLQTVTVKGGKEDPAYTIMRKAIAKANYHRNQLDSYSARVYIKGAGQLKDYPWLAKRQLEKEGIKKGRVFIQESVSEVKFTRPNKFEEKVISIRSDGKDNNTSPNQYIFGSFYEPEVAETISPLSPKAFSYYRFEYLGSFRDRNYEISKIKVTPRSRGDNVVEGTLYLVEDWWSIHSMDIVTTKLGVDITIKAVYAPVEDKVWLPVSHQFRVDGKIFGFEFEYKYLATVSDYRIQLNPELYVEPQQMEVVDEKIEREQARQIEKKFDQKDAKTGQLQERLASGKEITRKELRTMIKEYEKQEQQQQKEPEVISETNMKIDSGAYKKDSLYWINVRPVPLTKEEMEGYKVADSLAVVERKKEEGDTVKTSKHKGFQPWDILLGDSYKVGKHSNFQIHTPFGGFNTVEGWNLIYAVEYGTVFQDTSRTRFSIKPTFRYAFAREAASGNVRLQLRNRKYRIELEGGRYVQQLNPERPILPVINTFMTLFLERNLMKLYERDYIDFLYRRRISDYLTVSTSWSLSRRYWLENRSDYKLIDRDKIEGYTPNEPFNEELGRPAYLDVAPLFPQHEAFIGTVSLQAKPWLKYRIRNGSRQQIQESSPMLSLDYRKGFSGAFGSDVDFDHVELGFRHGFNVGVRGRVDIALRTGAFLNASSLYFMDFKHFLGNQTPFSTVDPVGNFRLLEYYRLSTSDKYLAGNLHYKFRRFLVTSFPMIRMMGVRENIFLNYLATPHSRNYTEVGYAIDGILRIFRLEGAMSFEEGQFRDYGFRLGITTNFGISVSQ